MKRFLRISAENDNYCVNLVVRITLCASLLRRYIRVPTEPPRAEFERLLHGDVARPWHGDSEALPVDARDATAITVVLSRSIDDHYWVGR